MATSKSLQLAAQAWCTSKTGHKEMDADLAEAFAEILDNRLAQRDAEIAELRKDRERLPTTNVKRLRKQKERLAYKIKRQAAQINNLVIALKGKLHLLEKAPRNGEWILAFDVDTGHAFVVRFCSENHNWEAMVGGWFEEDELRGWLAIPDSAQIKQPYRKLIDEAIDAAIAAAESKGEADATSNDR